MAKKLVVIAGPTAVGKTTAAIALAQTWKTVILSADSRQFFREMNVGTAKPSPEQQQLVRHYFIDSLSISDNYNAGDFERDALLLLADLFQRHDVVVLSGGSGLYIKALCEGMDNFPPVAPEIRQKLQRQYETEGIAFLQKTLAQVDPTYFKQVDTNNPQRLLRALEVCHSTGKPYSSFLLKEPVQRPFQIVKIALNMPRETLYRRINQRVESMMQDGLLAEAQNLYPYRHLNALQTVGYQELFDFLDKKHTLDQAVALIQQNTRRYAKRQLTWLNKNREEWQWFLPNDVQAMSNFAEQK